MTARERPTVGRFAGRKVLVTGGASGIGRAVADHFTDEGALVAILDRKPADAAAGRVTAYRTVDVADAAAVHDAVNGVADDMAGLDIVVNNAGVDFYGPFADMSAQEMDRITRVNMLGPMYVCQAALPFLKPAKAAAIVNIASAAGLSPIDFRTTYCASKAGLIMATKALAVELARYDIRANAVCPGAVDTDLFASSLDDDLTIDAVKARYAMGRIGDVSEIALAVLFLACKEASFVTGSALAVDGGRVFH